MFEFSHLQCFVAVAEELNFGRAAARLNMTQPPLSRQIQILEHILDVRLLERTSRSVSLTPAGRVFLTEARRILGLAEGAALTARRIASGQAGSLSLGFTAAAGYTLMPRVVAFCHGRLPGVDLVLKEMVTTDQVKALGANQIDVGFLRLSLDHREFDTLCIQQEPLLAAIPSGHRLGGRADLALEDFDGESLIMYSPYEARYLYDIVTSLFTQSGVRPNYTQYLSQIHSIVAMVSHGLGVAVVPKSAEALGMAGVVCRPLRIRPDMAIKLLLCWRKSSNNPALPGFIAAMRDYVGASLLAD